MEDEGALTSPEAERDFDVEMPEMPEMGLNF